jgi:amino acid adenylation domain-containing protein
MTVTAPARLDPARERFLAFPPDSPVRKLVIRVEPPAGVDRDLLARALTTLTGAYPDLLGGLAVQETVPGDATPDGPPPRAVLESHGAAVRLTLILDRGVVDHGLAGWLAERLAELCGQDGPSLPVSPPPSADNLAQLTADMLSELRSELADVPTDVLLPRLPRGIRPAGYASHEARIPPDVLANVSHTAEERGLPRQAVLIAAYQVLLHRYSRQPHMLIGVELDRPSTGSRRGMVADLVPVAAVFTHRTSLGSAAQAVAEALRRSGTRPPVPVPILAELLGRPVAAESPALYGTVFALRDPLPGTTGGTGWVCRAEPAAAVDCDLELSIRIDDTAQGAVVRFSYRSDAFHPVTIERLARHYVTLLDAGTREPEAPVHRLRVLGPDEEDLLLHRWSGRPDPWQPTEPLHRTVERHAGRTPDAPALIAGDTRLSYRELNDRADRLARHLRSLGVLHGDVVALCMDRSAAWLETLLAVFKIGAVAFPIDPRTPALRMGNAFDVIRPRLVVYAARREPPDFGVPYLALDDDRTAIDRPATGQAPTETPGAQVRIDDLAYVMLTSGSTGTPKAVFGQHKVIAHIGAGFAGLTGLTSDERASWMTPTGFGTTFAEVAQPLVVGACLVAVPGDLVASPADLRQWLLDRRIAVTFAVTQVGEGLQNQPWPEDCPLRILMMGGEKVHHWAPRELPFEVAVGYGCHEALFVTSPLYPFDMRVTNITAAEEDRLSPPPIGRPNPGTRLQILGDEGELMPPGAIGEIWFDSPEGALGYWGDPALTADNFRPDPYGPPGARHYRTGDLGRYRDDGLLEHHGRTDDMVKIRGSRVELGEVEAVMRTHPDVTEAAVVPVRARMGETTLVACLVLDDDIEPAELRSYLAARLPEYMVPIAYVPMPALPRSINNKIDRAALPPQDWATRRVRARYRAPAEGLETTIAEVWAEVLGEERLGADDNFLDLGGTSLHAGRLLSRLRATVPRPVSLRDVFLFPTPAGLARLLASREPEAVPALPPRISRRRR